MIPSRHLPPHAAALRAHDEVAGIGTRVAEKLAALEGALERTHGADATVRAHLADLRELLARQQQAEGDLVGEVEREVTDRTRDLSSLSHFLQTHGEREKAALARELHDSLGGILTPAKMDLAWLEARLADDPEYGPRIRRLSALIDQGIDLKRRIIEALRPSLLDHLGLASALQWYVDETCRDAHLEARIHVSDGLERLPPDLEIALYRVVQDGLLNVVKHAHARSFELELRRTAEGLEMTIGDDGVGIDDVERAMRLSHGLAGMVHRVRSLEGTFDVDSSAGGGTRIRIFVPLTRRRSG